MCPSQGIGLARGLPLHRDNRTGRFFRPRPLAANARPPSPRTPGSFTPNARLLHPERTAPSPPKEKGINVSLTTNNKHLRSIHLHFNLLLYIIYYIIYNNKLKIFVKDLHTSCVFWKSANVCCLLLNQHLPTLPINLRKVQKMETNKPARIVGHRDINKGKACPCFEAKTYNLMI